MTTKNKFVWVDDASRPNEVFNLGNINLPSSYALGAAGWLTDASSPYDSLLMILRTVCDQIQSRLPEYKIWFLAGTSAWQPDSRIVRHRGLWGALKARGIELGHSPDEPEVILESDGKLKFFGATLVSDPALAAVTKALLEERCTYLMALPVHISINKLVALGWSGRLREDVALLDNVNRTGGVIISKVGEFDDIERGLVAIANPGVLEKLAG